jgi:large subunit ribosomal protein L11
MAKKVKAVVTLQIAAGKANPAPPIGPALAQHGINLMGFCKEYNARTSNRIGEIIPAEITIFTDGSFKFNLKKPAHCVSLAARSGLEKGVFGTQPQQGGQADRQQVREIAEIKMKDLNAISVEGAMAQIEGTARSMGITVED